MPEVVLTNAYVIVNAVDLSNHVRQVKLTYEAETQDAATMGDTFRRLKAGLKKYQVDVDFNQDYALTSVDATLFAALGTAVTIGIRAVNSARSTTNPEYNDTMLVTKYDPLAGKVGDMAVATMTAMPGGAAGGAGLQRLTS